MHTTIPKGIVGSFEFTVLQSNLKVCHERPTVFQLGSKIKRAVSPLPSPRGQSVSGHYNYVFVLFSYFFIIIIIIIVVTIRDT